MPTYYLRHSSGDKFTIQLEKSFKETIEELEEGHFLYIPNKDGGTTAIGIEYLKSCIVEEGNSRSEGNLTNKIGYFK